MTTLSLVQYAERLRNCEHQERVAATLLAGLMVANSNDPYKLNEEEAINRSLEMARELIGKSREEDLFS